MLSYGPIPAPENRHQNKGGQNHQGVRGYSFRECAMVTGSGFGGLIRQPITGVG